MNAAHFLGMEELKQELLKLLELSVQDKAGLSDANILNIYQFALDNEYPFLQFILEAFIVSRIDMLKGFFPNAKYEWEYLIQNNIGMLQKIRSLYKLGFTGLSLSNSHVEFTAARSHCDV